MAILAGGNNFQLYGRCDDLWVFKIGGTMPPVAAPQAPPTPNGEDAPPQ